MVVTLQPLLQINEKLSSDAGLLDKMYAFLEAPPPLNPLLTSFFSKAFGVLITRRPEQVSRRSWMVIQMVTKMVMELVILPASLYAGC